MKKSKLLGTALLLLGSISILTACGNSNNNDSQSDKNSKKITSLEKQVKKNSSSSSSSVSSSSDSDSSNSSSSSMQNDNIDDKTVGTMVALLQEPDWFKDNVKDNAMFYGKVQNKYAGNDNQLKGYSMVTANGDPTSFIYYLRNGNNVTYKYWVPSKTKGVAGGHLVAKNVTVDQLVNDYYVNQNQKDEVNGYVNKLGSEKEYQEKQAEKN